MFDVIYHSQKPEYKKPFGAVQANEAIKFNIKANEPCDVKIIVKTEKGLDEFGLKQTGKDGDYYIYSVELDTSGYCGPVFYYFELKKDDGIYYYTNKEDLLGGEGELYSQNPNLFYHFYVYDLKYDVPEWFKTGIVYHVFVDRFNNDDCSLEDVFKLLFEVRGGNLRGIINKLDYLKDLGVSTILLSPIFESKTHHKYDTEDYMKIASDYGDLDTFKELIAELKKRDMHIILDGVFNHSGSNSIYFNKYGNHDELGAYQSKESRYYPWYKFNSFPDDYESWQGIDTLPAHDQTNEDFLDFLLFNEDSVVNYWMNLGIDGWRLDAADLLSDEFLGKLYGVVKKNNPDSVIVGELWNDATNFRFHSDNEWHKFVCGNEIESVIDYPMHGLMIEYSKGNHTPQTFKRGFYSLMENYPKEYFYSLLNFLGTHDIERVYFLLEGKFDLIKLAILLSLTLPGVPLIYYGDEAGLDGGKDPDNRRPMPWSNFNQEIYNHYSSLCKIRNSYDAFKKGSISFVENESLLIYKRSYGDENIYVVLNNSSDNEFVIEEDITLQDIENNEIFKLNDSIPIDGFGYRILIEKS